MRSASAFLRKAVTLAGGVAAGSMVLAFTGPPAGGGDAAHRAAAGPAASRKVTEVSRGCAGPNTEPVAAEAPPRRVYVAWIGCNGIGFARSADGGLHFAKPVKVPGSGGISWDPAVAVAPNGTVYVAYMVAENGFMRPVVAASFNHGVSFGRVVRVRPKVRNNWGDREFIAAGPHGRVYLTWDYGPSADKVQEVCDPAGSCSFSHGDVNAVIQKSTDGGRSWGPITPVGPHFPRNGGISAPVVARPGGRVDVLSWGHFVSKAPAYKISPGHEVFASSPDGTTWPRHPRTLWPGKGSIAIRVWWIDGALAADAGGTLYAAWDTQTSGGDTGWLTWSRDEGRTWHRPARVTGSRGRAMHLIGVAGGARGVVYAAWQTNANPAGYATWVRAYSTARGWLGKAIKVSPRFGDPQSWPGDTIGIATRPGTGRVSLTWGSAIGSSSDSQIWGTVVSLPARR